MEAAAVTIVVPPILRALCNSNPRHTLNEGRTLVNGVDEQLNARNSARLEQMFDTAVERYTLLPAFMS